MRSAWSIVLLTLLVHPARAQAPDLGRLPRAWRETGRVVAPDAQTKAIGERLGASLTRVENVAFDACGVPLKVNTIDCASEEDAARLVTTLAAGGKSPEAIARIGPVVIELVCGARPVIQAARAALGLDPPAEARWAVSFVASPLATVDPDPTAWNRLFNVLGAVRAHAVDADPAAVTSLAAGFGFADALRASDAKGWTVEPLEPLLELPRLRLAGEVVVRAFEGRTAERPAAALLAANSRWPADAQAVRAIVAEATAGASGERARVEALLGWVCAHLRYGGPMGSRWGTLRVLETGVGRCWDHADVLITLCRAGGVPARQVYGWLAGAGGHVWCEVYLDGAWWPVDATASWVGVSLDHVPFFVSDAGEVPAVYWGAPERLERARD